MMATVSNSGDTSFSMAPSESRSDGPALGYIRDTLKILNSLQSGQA